jgi:hypothetical protein
MPKMRMISRYMSVIVQIASIARVCATVAENACEEHQWTVAFVCIQRDNCSARLIFLVCHVIGNSMRSQEFVRARVHMPDFRVWRWSESKDDGGLELGQTPFFIFLSLCMLSCQTAMCSH